MTWQETGKHTYGKEIKLETTIRKQQETTQLPLTQTDNLFSCY